MQYDQEHYQRYHAIDVSKYSMHWWANRYYAAVLRRYVRGGRLLEIGCGTGFFLAELSRHFRVYGVDTSDFALKHARVNCHRDDIRRMKGEDISAFPRDYFDAVVSRHVFEHMEEPAITLQGCYGILKPGGILLYVVPNMASISRRWKGPDWYGYRDETHITMLSPHGWLDLTRGAGFAVEKSYSDGLWDVPYIPRVPSWIQKPLFGFLGGVQALLSLSFMPIPLGEALIVLARKPAG
jgi:SAM-dependent methyltransferase